MCQNLLGGDIDFKMLVIAGQKYFYTREEISLLREEVRTFEDKFELNRDKCELALALIFIISYRPTQTYTENK